MTSPDSIVRPSSIQDLQELEGTELGPTAWLEMTQELVDGFADLTGDRQWIHVDPARASASALGGTIAHGLLTLSLGPKWMGDLLSFEGFAASLNYGYEKIRFPAPLKVGSRIRMRATITAVHAVSQGLQVTVTQTMECEGATKPVCVAEAVARLVQST